MSKIIVLIFVAAIVFLSWCCCKVSGDCDDYFINNFNRAITCSRNKISTRVIVDKEYTSGFYSTDYWVSPSHRLTILGEKNGKIVEYTFEVDEATYGKYNIGEFYP